METLVMLMRLMLGLLWFSGIAFSRLDGWIVYFPIASASARGEAEI